MWSRLLFLAPFQLSLPIFSLDPGSFQYPANRPIEDRHHFARIDSHKATCGAVFDGHGGWQVSDYLNSSYFTYLTQFLNQTPPNQSSIFQILNSLFNKLQQDVVQAARAPYQMGYSQVSSTGSCAILAVVFQGWYAVANTGDCQGVLVSKKQGKITGKNICQIHSSNLPSEQERLRKQHPGENDIVVCKREQACYVKGRLMPSKAFGDLHLKHQEFNNPKGLSILHGFRKPRIRNFSGPYITHQPDIKVNEIREGDKFIILASDGLWDQMSQQQAAELVADYESAKEAAEVLVKTALEISATKRRMTVEQLEKIELGKRRSYHDDISVVVLPLTQDQINQVTEDEFVQVTIQS